MSDLGGWPLALSAVGALAAIGFLVHAIITAILARVDALGANMVREMTDRFAAAETRRQEASAAWGERIASRDRDLDALRQDFNALRDDLPNSYVRTDRYMEVEGRQMIMMERLKESLARIEGNQHAA